MAPLVVRSRFDMTQVVQKLLALLTKFQIVGGTGECLEIGIAEVRRHVLHYVCQLSCRGSETIHRTR